MRKIRIKDLSKEAQELIKFLRKQGWKFENAPACQDEETLIFTQTVKYCPLANGPDKEKLTITLTHFQ